MTKQMLNVIFTDLFSLRNNADVHVALSVNFLCASCRFIYEVEKHSSEKIVLEQFINLKLQKNNNKDHYNKQAVVNISRAK